MFREFSEFVLFFFFSYWKFRSVSWGGVSGLRLVSLRRLVIKFFIVFFGWLVVNIMYKNIIIYKKLIILLYYGIRLILSRKYIGFIIEGRVYMI